MTNQTRRPRHKINRIRRVGIANRQRGICTKANSFAELYAVDVVVAIRRPDGRTGGYESKPGLARQLLNTTDLNLMGPTELNAQEGKNAKADLRSAADASSPSDSSACSSGQDTSSLKDWRVETPLTPPLSVPLDQMNTETGMENSEATNLWQGDFMGLPWDSVEAQELDIIQPTPVSMKKKSAILNLINSYF